MNQNQLDDTTKPRSVVQQQNCSAEWEYAQRVAAEKSHLDFVNNVITSINMLAGWKIIELLRWKTGVVKYIAERSLHGRRERQIGYAKDEVFESLQLPPNGKDQA
jgi:hypothetical protein